MCRAGTKGFDPTEGFDPPHEFSCKNCSAGKTSFENATECVTCSKGKFAQSDSAICANCPVGYFQPQQVQPSTRCTKCPAGYKQPEVGEASCVDLGQAFKCATLDAKRIDVECRCGKVGALCVAGKYCWSSGECQGAARDPIVFVLEMQVTLEGIPWDLFENNPKMMEAFKATVAWFLGDGIDADDVYHIKRILKQRRLSSHVRRRRLAPLEIAYEVKTLSKELADKATAAMKSTSDEEFSEQLIKEMKKRGIFQSGGVKSDDVKASKSDDVKVRRVFFWCHGAEGGGKGEGRRVLFVAGV